MYPLHHVEGARLCAAVYETEDVWSVRETDALVVVRDHVIDIAFRGTEFSRSWPMVWSWEGLSNTRDVIRDLRFIPHLDKMGYWCHKGFSISAEAFASHFALRLLRYRLPLRFFGHSLGGGIAPHAARWFRNMGFDVVEVVTFGEPASCYFGSEYKYRALNIPTTSYLHANDFIRKTPPWGNPSVERTHINPKKGVSRTAHDMGEYIRALMHP